MQCSRLARSQLTKDQFILAPSYRGILTQTKHFKSHEITLSLPYLFERAQIGTYLGFGKVSLPG